MPAAMYRLAVLFTLINVDNADNLQDVSTTTMQCIPGAECDTALNLFQKTQKAGKVSILEQDMEVSAQTSMDAALDEASQRGFQDGKAKNPINERAIVATTDQYCPIASLLIPPAVFCLFGAVALFAVFRSILVVGRDANDPLEFVLCLGVFNSFQENMLFTMVLVHAFDFMHSLGAGAVTSGTLIGMHKMGTSCGTAVLCMGVHMNPKLWRFSRPIILLGAWLQIISGFVFGALGFAAMEHSQVKLPVGTVVNLLFAVRFVQGFGGGLQVSLALNQSAQTTSGNRRETQNMRVLVGACLGLGAGPLIMSAAWWVATAMPCSGRLGSRLMLPLVAVLPLMQLAVLLPLEVPSLEGVSDIGEKAIATGKKRGCCRVAVVLMCIFMQVVLNLCLAALEAGVSILFQTKYGWSRGRVGLGTSAIVFAALPVQLIWEQIKTIMAPEAWTIVMLWTSIATAILLRVCDANVLQGAPMILFPLMALSSGLILSKMQDHALPRGSLLDLNTSTLLGLVVMDFAGRGGGPVAARWSVSRFGQEGFAWLLIGGCGATTFVYHITLCISYHLQDSSKEPNRRSPQSTPLAMEGCRPPKMTKCCWKCYRTAKKRVQSSYLKTQQACRKGGGNGWRKAKIAFRKEKKRKQKARKNLKGCVTLKGMR